MVRAPLRGLFVVGRFPRGRVLNQTSTGSVNVQTRCAPEKPFPWGGNSTIGRQGAKGGAVYGSFVWFCDDTRRRAPAGHWVTTHLLYSLLCSGTVWPLMTRTWQGKSRRDGASACLDSGRRLLWVGFKLPERASLRFVWEGNFFFVPGSVTVVRHTEGRSTSWWGGILYVNSRSDR